MIFAYLSVNSFMRNESNPGPPAVIRTVCGLTRSRRSTVRTACGRAGRARPASLVVDSVMITSLLTCHAAYRQVVHVTSDADVA
jgi:hypothetical protein